MTIVWVAIGAAVGAPLRYLIDRSVQAWHRSRFPWGTLTVNVVGSFILGVVTAITVFAEPAAVAVIGTGFCGALTTYSTFGYETFALLEQRAGLVATVNVLGSVAVGVTAAALGLLAGGLLA
ncbi:fluoride efflux transporter CrcB [Pseudonocardia sp. GCM10023141]|uniref:fluoride efflux transporter CrcB n=1 Tax=Pseudonocardia sp. GCM10023141 TaxID=3252653 RepID=UPI00361FC7E6